METCIGKGSICFLLPVAIETRQQHIILTKEESKTTKRAKHARKLQRRKANAALKRPATAVATQLEKLNEESTTLTNEIKSIEGPAESVCKMIEECDRKFEENIESIARMHESPMRKNKPRKNMI